MTSTAPATPPPVSASDSLKAVTSSGDYVELTSAEGFAIDLRYATTNNFVGENMYGDFNRAFLHKLAAAKLFAARDRLRKIDPKLKLLIFDALRPRSVQRILWRKVEGTGGEKYVMNPKNGSVHNFGFAVDLSIVDATGKELDMGTEYDFFAPLAQPRYEEKFLREGKLSKQHVANRKLLRSVMEESGFAHIPNEWWHFDALSPKEVRGKFKIVE